MTKKTKSCRIRIQIRKIFIVDLRHFLYVYCTTLMIQTFFWYSNVKIMLDTGFSVSFPVTPDVPSQTTYMEPQRACALQTVPNLYKPKAATRDRPIGNGFCVLIALGIELPASSILANTANSTPYGWRLRMRRPPRPYYARKIRELLRFWSSRWKRQGAILGRWIL